MHRSINYAVMIPRGEKAMRHLVLFVLLWIVCLVAAWGCGKEPPVVRQAPLRKIPTQDVKQVKTP